MQNLKHFMAAVGIIVLPMLCIVGQRETGSALVYLSFFLMLYREGMPGAILFTGVSMVAYFVVGVKYENVMMWDTYTSVGKFVVLLLVQIFTAGMVNSYTGDRKQALMILAYSVGITLLFVLFSTYVIPFDIVWIQLFLCAMLIGFLVYQGLRTRFRNYFLISIFSLGSIAFFYSADYVLNHVMEPIRECVSTYCWDWMKIWLVRDITCIRVRLPLVLADFREKVSSMERRPN